MHFSWSDGVHAAFATCLPCFQSPSDHDPDYAFTADERGTASSSHHHANQNPLLPPPRARPDELEGLLRESDDADAETLSLHSRFGDDEQRRRKRRRRKRQSAHKGVRLFGFDLFGRAPIQLPDSDSEDAGADEVGQRRERERERTVSTSTLDSDAAPLDSATISELSAARAAAAAAQAAAEEEQRKAKEERRRLRRERKELKRMAMALSTGMGQPGAEDDEAFEGFQGSGAGALPRSGPYSNSDSVTSASYAEDFGPFAQAQQFSVMHTHAYEPQSPTGDDADFGAESYARRAPNVASPGGSDSRSRASNSNSGSNSNSTPYKGQLAYQALSQAQQHQYLPQPTPLSPFVFPEPALAERERPKKSRSGRSARGTSSKQSETASASSLQTSQSPSLPSPPPEESLSAADARAHAVAVEAGQFEGFPGLSLEHARVEEEVGTDVGVLKDGTAGGGGGGGFPSSGLRGVRRTNSSDVGVFLARRGDA